MCGIVGVANGKAVSKQLIHGLKNLEYRGYDSAGIATHTGTDIWRKRAKGSIHRLEKAIESNLKDGAAGIGHTRWATHGAPSRRNAHPHIGTGIAAVHNGIIENFSSLRSKLEEKGILFQSDTDSEVIPHLISFHRQQGLPPLHAIHQTVSQLEGQFALAMLFDDMPGTVFAARSESPLSIGANSREAVLASDLLAFAGHLDQDIFLESGEIAILNKKSVQLFDQDLQSVSRSWRENKTSVSVNKLGKHEHFMHKEIYEQPDILEDLCGHDDMWDHLIEKLPEEILKTDDLEAIACGTSLFAAMCARDWFEEYAGISIHTEYASEFRYRKRRKNVTQTCLFISQSGETADTLASLRHAKSLSNKSIALVNVTTSTMALEADIIIPTRAGHEIGVASTKAFTAQLATLFRLAIEIGRKKEFLSPCDYLSLRHEYSQIPKLLQKVLEKEDEITAFAENFLNATSSIFVGRGASLPLALEGALKLKEISYIHAEGFPAGELKHGPIALVDEKLPAVILAPTNRHFAKTMSNASEIAARGGKVLVVTDDPGVTSNIQYLSLPLPCTTDNQMPFVYSIALQLIAYHAAKQRDLNIDKPRNLAKSVTVE